MNQNISITMPINKIGNPKIMKNIAYPSLSPDVFAPAP
jgi:hypothetical protein